MAPAIVARASEPALSANQYVDRLREAVIVAHQGATNPSVDLMQRLQGAAGPVSVLVDGEVVAVPADPFLEGLGGRTTEDFERAARHLDALVAAAGSVEAPAVPAAQIRAALGPAYDGIRASPGFLSRARRWVDNLLATVVRGVSSVAGPGGIVLWLFVAVFALCVMVLLRRFGLQIVPERRISPARGGAAIVDWQRVCDEAIARGDLTEAIRALYHVLVSSLRDRGIVPDTSTLTSGECRLAVAVRSPSLSPAVDAASTVFERVVYGGAPVDRTEVETLRTAARQAGAR